MAPLVVLLAVASVSGGAAQGIKSIDRQCGSGVAAGRAHKEGLRVFADLSTAVLPRPREGTWREFDSEAELRSFAESQHAPNTEAVVARESDGTTLVSMYFQSDAGDWAHVVDYCFRPTGTLQRMAGTFNSYRAAAPARTGIRRRRTTYFDVGGAMLQSRTRVFDLDTNKPLPGLTFTDESDPLYPAVQALPFSQMLSAPSDATDPSASPVARAVKERLPAVKACYDKVLRHAPTLSGKAVARWTIDEAGAVTAFSWESDQIGNATFSSCARRVIEGWTFPPPAAGPTVVSFPFVFKNSDEDVAIAPSAPRKNLDQR